MGRDEVRREGKQGNRIGDEGGGRESETGISLRGQARREGRGGEVVMGMIVQDAGRRGKSG